jgi:hypothetical protein
MGKAMIPALDELVSQLESPIPVLVCHQQYAEWRNIWSH